MSSKLWLPRNFRNGFTTIAGAGQVTTLIYTVPAGRYAILEDVFAFITNHGNAINTTALVINTTSGGIIHDILRIGNVAAPASPLITNRDVSIYLDEGDIINVVTNNTGAANVAMTTSLHLKERQG